MENKRRKPSIFDIDSLFNNMLRDIEETFKMLEEEFTRLATTAPGVKGPYYYGVRITIGPDGVPKVEEFGNIRKMEGKPVFSEEIEPLVDVVDADDEIWVIAELPGVEKDKIKVKVTEDTVTIRAENGKKYYKKVELPAKVDPKTAKAKYKNGVLDIRIKKVGAKQEGAVDVKVE